MTTPRSSARLIFSPLSTVLGLVVFCLATLAPKMTETAVANGDTRTIHLYHAHTHESISATYLVNGQYDAQVLHQLNWFLRDWRRDEPTNMDPRLFDVVWEAYRHAGAGDQVVHVVSAYRSPETNAMLRARSRAVAKYSQHMLGKAMDTTMPGMPMSQIREIGMRMQRGGVGYYPTAGTPFVHLDVGNVRAWPRMSYDELARLFPDGKTVHLPTNGQPLARYEEARAEIEARGDGAYVVAPRRTFGGFFAMLFGGGGGGEEEDAEVAAPAPSARKQWASLAPRPARGTSGEMEEQSAAAATTDAYRYGAKELSRAEADLPRGETTLSAPGAEAPEQEPPAAKLPTVRAPLPPQRPSSLAARLDARTASDRSAELQSAVDFQDADRADRRSGRMPATDAPPRRPKLASAPLPPTRPGPPHAKATSAIARLVDSPKNETRKSRAAAGHESLAYAPEPPQGAEPSDAAAGENNGKAVAEQATTRGATPLLGSSTGLRAAARSRGRSPTNKGVSAEHDAETPAR
ncbi:MAG: DUF882 domain-containing protein [Methylocystis silviterrae]|uniref:DUF882 domain-containing protein n=1 Tax=Methylocystis silviterrae TaxID=2743612 RepID=UPI003C7136C8